MYMQQEKEFNISNRLGECKKYSSTIIEDLCKVLDKRKYKYITNDVKNEIIISKRNITKSDVLATIEKDLPIPTEIVSLLVNMYQLKNQVIIRQKRK